MGVLCVCVSVCEHTWLHSHTCFHCLLTKHMLFIALKALALIERQPVWECHLSPLLFPTLLAFSLCSGLTMQMGSTGTLVLFQCFILLGFLYFYFSFKSMGV